MISNLHPLLPPNIRFHYEDFLSCFLIRDPHVIWICLSWLDDGKAFLGPRRWTIGRCTGTLSFGWVYSGCDSTEAEPCSFALKGLREDQHGSPEYGTCYSEASGWTARPQPRHPRYYRRIPYTAETAKRSIRATDRGPPIRTIPQLCSVPSGLYSVCRKNTNHNRIRLQTRDGLRKCTRPRGSQKPELSYGSPHNKIWDGGDVCKDWRVGLGAGWKEKLKRKEPGIRQRWIFWGGIRSFGRVRLKKWMSQGGRQFRKEGCSRQRRIGWSRWLWRWATKS